MTLQELRITSYLFTKFSNYDENYVDISAKNFDLEKKDDLNTILTFLRNWGCRQFKKTDNNLSARSLKMWYKKISSILPKQNNLLVDTSDKKIKSYTALFDDLMNSTASVRNRKENDVDTKVGPVGAAKTLFALRKNFFPPWDNPIINNLDLSKNGEGYCKYLILVKTKLLTLKDYCDTNSIDFYSLPTMLGRPHTSLAKLADEYLWVSITRNCVPKEIIKLTKGG